MQERAGDLALDVAGDDGRARLRALVDDEVAAWSRDFKRGLRAFDLADPELVATRAYRNLAGYGPLEPLLADDDVWEIMINGPDQIFVKRHQGPSSYHDEVFNDDEHVVRTLTKILDDASGSHRKLDPAEGLQDAQLDTGARLHIVHGDVGRDGHILVNIRKFTGVPFRSCTSWSSCDMLDTRVAEFLRACVRARLSTVFSGAPGSGKTTLLSCCAAELDPSLRVVIAEEVFEADLPLPNVASMQTRPARQDRPRGRPAAAGVRVPAHGARHRRGRRGPRPGGPAPVQPEPHHRAVRRVLLHRLEREGVVEEVHVVHERDLLQPLARDEVPPREPVDDERVARRVAQVEGLVGDALTGQLVAVPIVVDRPNPLEQVLERGRPVFLGAEEKADQVRGHTAFLPDSAR